MAIYAPHRSVSLKKVAGQIKEALEDDYHEADLITQPDFSVFVDREHEAFIFVHVFDPLYIQPWVYKAYSLLSRGFPVAFYTTVEGIPLMTSAYEWMVRYVKYTAVSRYVAKRLAGVGADVPWIVHHGIAFRAIRDAGEAAERVARAFGWPEGKTVALYVAAGYPRKGHDLFARALKALSKMDRGIHVVVVTDEKGSQHYSGLDNVTVLPVFGQLSEEELYALYHAADFYVHPALAEGFGLPVAEALAAGKLVVHPDYEPLSEITTEDTSVRVKVSKVEFKKQRNAGIMYEHHLYDPKAFAEAMVRAKELVDERGDRIAEQAVKRVEPLDYIRHYKVFERIMHMRA